MDHLIQKDLNIYLEHTLHNRSLKSVQNNLEYFYDLNIIKDITNSLDTVIEEIIPNISKKSNELLKTLVCDIILATTECVTDDFIK